jgi:beta-lactamase regulating signal transducer with metallopeptidase domain
MIHLIHSCVLALVLYLLYRFVLKGTQGFQAHRFYLLAIPLVSFLLPLLVIPMNQAMVPGAFLTQEVPSMVPVIINANAGTTATAVQPFMNLETLIWSIYGIGVATALLFFMYKLARIQQWKEEGETRYVDGCYITAVYKLPTAFSFLDHIYINNAIAKAQYDQILLHEQTHVKERHSWDLLFYEFLRILFWFHPVSYLAQQDLKLIHEHIADRQTIAVHGKQSYYENLLKQAMDCPDFSFANPFFKLKTIKTRIAMIQQTQNSRFPMRKLLWMLPILFASLTYTACTTVQEPDNITSVDAKMIEFSKDGKYSDVTQEEFELIKKIKEHNFVEALAGGNENYYTLLEKARVQHENLITESIASINVIKNDDEQRVDIVYKDEKLYQAILKTRFIKELNKKELNNLLKAQRQILDNEKIVEIVEVEEVILTNSDNIEIVEKITDVPFAIIESVPTYPGCSGNNAEKKKCMQEKITRFVNDNFNTALANNLSLTGKQKIAIQFKIDKNGDVVGVLSRANAPELQAEAARVINLLPKMKPGMQRGKEVGVIYGLPIIFEVSEETKKD